MNGSRGSPEEARRRLFDRLRNDFPGEKVVESMERVPRELFVPEASKHLAYEDNALPIGQGQSISQPYIVALMASELELRPSDRVLEVGTGSGYQAAVLAGMAREVITVERIEELGDSARQRLSAVGCTNVRVVLAVKELGWPAEAPYDAIIVAAGAPKLPRSLMDQMEVGGRLVVPVGGASTQELMMVTRSSESFAVRTLGPCRFVPLISEDAWPDPGAEDDV